MSKPIFVVALLESGSQPESVQVPDMKTAQDVRDMIKNLLDKTDYKYTVDIMGGD